MTEKETAQKLSLRERKVVRLLGMGVKQRKIAEVLGLGVRTVQREAAVARRKLDAASTAQLLNLATEDDLTLKPDVLEQLLRSLANS